MTEPHMTAARIIDPSLASAPHPLGLTNNPEWAATRQRLRRARTTCTEKRHA